MPLMTNPLAHIEMLLEKYEMYGEEWGIELERLKARHRLVLEMASELRRALDEERGKLQFAAGDADK